MFEKFYGLQYLGAVMSTRVYWDRNIGLIRLKKDERASFVLNKLLKSILQKHQSKSVHGNNKTTITYECKA